MKLLDIILSNLEGLYITDDGALVNIDESSNVSYVNNFFSPDRPLLISELVEKLNQRGWHSPIRKIIDAQGKENLVSDLSNTMDVSGNLVVSDVATYKPLNFESGANSNQDLSEYSSIIQLFKNMQESNNIYLFSSSRYSIDILNNSITLDLVSPSQYTNTVSLSNVIQKSGNKDINTSVDLTVKYSKMGEISSKDLSFSMLRIDTLSDGTVSSVENNFVNKVDNQISIEFIDGVVRVIPIDNAVDECIISNCVITYGGI